MSAGAVAGLVLALVSFVVLIVVLIVVALEPHEPTRRGLHRRDPTEGAR